MKFEHSYLVKIQFLGFRYHGWQRQTKVKTLHEMIDKTLFYVLEHDNFKTLGVGRTDSKVSASAYYFQLFTNDVQLAGRDFINLANSNFPSDIKVLSIVKVPLKFNIIQHPKIKEYLYLFSFGSKNHPFGAPMITGFKEELDLDQMKKGASLFEGEHFFNKYCTKPSEDTNFKREILSCEILENNLFKASFFPEKSYILRVKGKGFLRYQIRLMMGVLIELGRGQLTLDFIKNSLTEDNDGKPLKQIAPSSGLQLYSIDFQDLDINP